MALFDTVDSVVGTPAMVPQMGGQYVPPIAYVQDVLGNAGLGAPYLGPASRMNLDYMGGGAPRLVPPVGPVAGSVPMMPQAMAPIDANYYNSGVGTPYAGPTAGMLPLLPNSMPMLPANYFNSGMPPNAMYAGPLTGMIPNDMRMAVPPEEEKPAEEPKPEAAPRKSEGGGKADSSSAAGTSVSEAQKSAEQKGWLDRLKDMMAADPALARSLVTFGAMLTQPYDVKQNSLGHFTQALKGATDQLYADRAAKTKLDADVAESKAKAGYYEKVGPAQEVEAKAKMISANAAARKVDKGEGTKGAEQTLAERLSESYRVQFPDKYPATPQGKEASFTDALDAVRTAKAKGDAAAIRDMRLQVAKSAYTAVPPGEDINEYVSAVLRDFDARVKEMGYEPSETLGKKKTASSEDAKNRAKLLESAKKAIASGRWTPEQVKEKFKREGLPVPTDAELGGRPARRTVDDDSDSAEILN